MNNKAQLNIFIFVIGAFLVVMMFAGWIYVTGLLNDVFTEIGLENEKNVNASTYVNMTKASQDIFGRMAVNIQDLRMVAVVYIFALGASIIITSGLMKVNAIWFFAYILIVILAIILAPQISNAYETILASNIYGGELNNFTIANFLLLNLPIVTMVVGVLGGIFLFINMVRGGAEGGL